MQIYMFASTAELDLRGYTADPRGTNLPANYGPWFDGCALDMAVDTDPIAKAVHKNGYLCVSPRNIWPL